MKNTKKNNILNETKDYMDTIKTLEKTNLDFTNEDF